MCKDMYTLYNSSDHPSVALQTLATASIPFPSGDLRALLLLTAFSLFYLFGCNLHGEDTTEGSGPTRVYKFDKANIRLFGDGSMASCSGWDLDSEGLRDMISSCSPLGVEDMEREWEYTDKVLINLGGTSHHTHSPEHISPTTRLGSFTRRMDLAVIARNLLRDVCFNAFREFASSSWVNDGGVGSCTVGRHDVQKSVQAATLIADLREGVAGQVYYFRYQVEGVLASTWGFAKSVRRGIKLAKDCCVDFGLGCGSCTRNDTA